MLKIIHKRLILQVGLFLKMCMYCMHLTVIVHFSSLFVKSLLMAYFVLGEEKLHKSIQFFLRISFSILCLKKNLSLNGKRTECTRNTSTLVKLVDFNSFFLLREKYI